MGYVYTPEQVEQHEVPEITDFDKAVEVIRSGLGDPAILAALLCGSYRRGEHTRRSDIDCVVVCHAEDKEGVIDTLEEIKRETQKFHIPVEFNIFDTSGAGGGKYTLGENFYRDLKDAQENGGAIKNNIFDFLPEESEVVDCKKEAIGKTRKRLDQHEESLSEQENYTDNDHAYFLARTLAAPMVIARNVVGYHGHFVFSKKEVREEYAQLMPDQELVKIFSGLVALDEEYTTFLEGQLDSFDRESYETFLKKIENAVPQVTHFIEANLEYLESLEQNVGQEQGVAASAIQYQH